jgi:hypothetical protein
MVEQMTYSAAIAQLVSVVKAIAPSSLYEPGTFGQGFLHFPHFDVEESMPSRAFTFRTVSRSLDPRYPASSGARHVYTSADLLLYHAPFDDGDRLDAACNADWAEIVKVLSSDSNWGDRATTTIEGVGVGDADLFDSDTEETENGGRVTTIRIALTHRI